ncbi:MAG: DUF6298 domain-containing protein, partial [Pseudomonadota bacterium]
YVDQNKNAVWGYAGHNSWWQQFPNRPNITRNGGGAGPLHTVDIAPFASSLKRFGFAGYEHNYGLWYDRRRDAHDTACRPNSNVVGPTLEQPWARSGSGTACDGRSKYDLTTFNSFYFERLASFAAAAEQNGVIFINNFYMQHALLEVNAHYVDFPWRPGNNIQNAPMPSSVPAANSFYNVSNSQMRSLHRLYINKMLDTLRDYPNVVHLVSQEYTGNLSFMRFWIDTIKDWEAANGKRVHIGLGATKDVQDAILNDSSRSKDISSVNLQYWWYQSNGQLFAPPGGVSYAGRYSLGTGSAGTTPQQIYRQIREYRERVPKKALLHHIRADLQQTWAFLMGGGSLLIRYITYPSVSVRDYNTAPIEFSLIRHTYNFVNNKLASILPTMIPADLASNSTATVWSLTDHKKAALFYLPNGGSFDADLSRLSGQTNASWFNPTTGVEIPIGTVNNSASVPFSSPGGSTWALLLK